MIPYKSILSILASIGLIFFSAFSLNPGLINYFSVSLPIAIRKGFPVPVCLWIGFAVYALIIARMYKISYLRVFKAIIFLGVFTHLSLLLLGYRVQIAVQPQIFSSVYYKLYSYVFIACWFSALGVFTAYRLANVYGVLLSKEEGYRRDTGLYSCIALFFYGLLFLLQQGFILECCIILGVFISAYYYLLRWSSSGMVLIKHIASVLIREKVLLPVLFLFAIAIRLFYLSRIMGDANCIETGSDATLYDGLARSLIRGDKVTEVYATGYWMFLALVYKFFGTQYYIIGSIQCLISSLSCIFLYYAVKFFFNPAVARIALFISVCSFSSIFSAVAIGYQVLDIFYLSLVFMLFSIYAHRQRYGFKRYAFLGSMGILCGLSMVTREINFFFPIIMIILIFKFSMNKGGFKHALTDSLIIMFFICVLLLPFIIRNINNLGTWYPIVPTSGAGWDVTQSVMRGENPDLIRAGIDFTNLRQTWSVFAVDPMDFMRHITANFMNKFLNIYFNQGYGGFDILFLYRLSSYYYALWFYIYVFTLIGIVTALIRYKFSPHLLMILFIVYRTLVHFFTEGSYRHRAPIDPFLIAYLSFGIFLLIQYVNQRKPVNDA
ncbi:MAG: hypothetical protein ABIG46_06880 [Candidatus Omnitrophota bacterium]